MNKQDRINELIASSILEAVNNEEPIQEDAQSRQLRRANRQYNKANREYKKNFSTYQDFNQRLSALNTAQNLANNGAQVGNSIVDNFARKTIGADPAGTNKMMRKSGIRNARANFRNKKNAYKLNAYKLDERMQTYDSDYEANYQKMSGALQNQINILNNQRTVPQNVINQLNDPATLKQVRDNAAAAAENELRAKAQTAANQVRVIDDKLRDLNGKKTWLDQEHNRRVQTDQQQQQAYLAAHPPT